MTRGKKPEVAIFDAKEFAERMGYMPIDNPHENLQFDFLIFKRDSIRVVIVRKTRIISIRTDFTTNSSRMR